MGQEVPSRYRVLAKMRYDGGGRCNDGGNWVGYRHPSPILGLWLQSQMNSPEPVPRSMPSIQ